MTNYLDTNSAVEQYANMAFNAKGDTSKFANDWKDNLEDHGVTVTEDLNEEDILPKKIIGSIQDVIKQDNVFTQFSPVFNIDAGSLVVDPSDHINEVIGHTRNANKKLQSVTLQSRDILPKAIYKLQRMDHMTYLKGGALVQWVLTELPKWVLRRLSQAILVGGVVNEDGSKFDAVKPIIGDVWAQKSSLASNASADTLKTQLLTDVASVDATNPVIFVNPKTWVKLATSGDAWSVAMLNGSLDLGGKLVKTNILDDTHPYVIVDPTQYLIGFSGSGIETLAAFQITQNSQYIESRAYVAGTLMRPGVAVYAETAGK